MLQSLANLGEPVDRVFEVKVERREDGYRAIFHLDHNKNPFKETTLYRFRQDRLWRWDRDVIQIISAWPEVDGWIKKRGDAWLTGCPVLPRNFLTLTCPQVLMDDIEPKDAPDLTGLDNTNGPLDENEQGWVDKAYGRANRRSEERFCRMDEADAAWEFSCLIPSRHLELARRYYSENFAILQALAQTHGFAELIPSNAALALMVARNDIFGDSEATDRLGNQRELLDLRRRDALAKLGFPGTDQVERLLRKIPDQYATISNLKKLRTILWQPEACKVIAHAINLSGQELEFFLSGWGVLSPVALRVSLVNQDGRRIAKMLRLITDCEQMSKQIDESWPTGRHFDGLGSLRRCHDQLVEKIHQAAYLPFLNTPFPASPIPPVDGIEPITTCSELQEEGRNMKHCVMSHIKEIIAGDYFVFKVERPERATLALSRVESPARPGVAQWEFSELQGFRNTEVSAETLEHVHSWLQQHRAA